MARDGDPPFYGQPNRPRRPQETETGITAKLTTILERIENIMSILIRDIAGVSFTNITCEVIVLPIEIADLNTVLAFVQPTDKTIEAERYIVGLKLDMGDEVKRLPLNSIIFSRSDIESKPTLTIPFDVSDIDLDGIKGYITEVFLDTAIADLDVGEATLSISADIGFHNILFNVGNGGLAGFDIELTIGDPSIAKFVGATFPTEFPLSDIVPDPVDGAILRIRGVDLGDQVNPNDLQVMLATVDIVPLAIGVSPLTATITRLDDEDGNPIQSVINNGSITVTA